RSSELRKVNADLDAEGDNAETSSSLAGEQGPDDDALGSGGEGGEQEEAEEVAPKKTSRKKPHDVGATTGDKRGVDDEGQGGAEGDKTKKVKTGKDASDGAERKGPGRSRKGSKVKKLEAHGEGEIIEVEVQGEGITETKRRAHGRPKKSDASDHAPATISADAPAAHTRSRE
ncbi:hypothetical protein C0991_001889, partial [Blastosporella zonata]